MAAVDEACSVVGETLTVATFEKLSGILSGYRYVKLVVDRSTDTIHFIDSARDLFHVQYVAKWILNLPPGEIERTLDEFNRGVMHDDDRRFYLATLSSHVRDGREFYALETTEVDTMSLEMLRDLYATVCRHVADRPVVIKPANHMQEEFLAPIPRVELPWVHPDEIYSSASFVPLRPGAAEGRLRVFRDDEEYRAAEPLELFDIVVMDRVPGDIPRVAGIINARHTTPLSHTNILARGWGVPNAVQLGVLDEVERDGLDGRWVSYEVDPGGTGVSLRVIDPPTRRGASGTPAVVMPTPDITRGEIVPLDVLRRGDALRYGTKAANLGEVSRVLADGSDRLLEYYQRPRPPRANLLPYLGALLGVDHTDADALGAAANALLRETIEVPAGVALPFSVLREYVDEVPGARERVRELLAVSERGGDVEPVRAGLCQALTGAAPSAGIRRRIEDAVARRLGAAGRFVVRSSSNAEDLPGFSAAGVYESVTEVTEDGLVDAVVRVWVSLLSARVMLLRAQAGIRLADCEMGVIIQRQVDTEIGGVLVTTNPTEPRDIRGVFVNISPRSVVEVVNGAALPIQHVYNTMEGGGRTVSLGDAVSDVDSSVKERLRRLALAGRLLQSHFGLGPVDIEWVAGADRIRLVQLRPFAG